MSRVAGYDPISMPSVDFDISSQYSPLAETQYQGNDIMLASRNSGMSYAPSEQVEYRLAPQILYDVGAVQSPAIGAVQPRQQDANALSADIADLPIIKKISAQPSQSFTYHGLTVDGDYSMVAASTNQLHFETGKQDLARAVLRELETLDNRHVLLQTN